MKYVVLTIIILSTLVRFYQISHLFPFLGDQGRDLLEIYQSLSQKQLPLAGPLSNQNVHAGPAYYYLLIPPLLLGNWQPIWPAVFLTSFSIISVYLLFSLGKNLFGSWPALLGAALYAFSPVIISRTQGIWNPVTIPFFVLLTIFSLYQIQQTKFLWFICLGFSVGIAVQLYAPAWFLFIPVGFWWLFHLIYPPCPRSRFWKHSLVGLVIFPLTLLPFVVFQIKTGFTDLQNLSQITHPSKLNQLITAFSLFSEQFEPLTLNSNFLLNLTLGFLCLFFSLPKKFDKKFPWPFFFSCFLIIGLIALSFYPTYPPPHYASFLWPIPFLLIMPLSERLKILIPIALGIVIPFYLFIYFTHLSPQDDLTRAQKISQEIAEIAKDQPFSLLLISTRSSSDAHLRYLLTLSQTKIQKDYQQSLLFLVCDQQPCPSLNTLAQKKFVESYCLPKCPTLDHQKEIELKNWQFIRSINLSRSQIYLLKKTQKPT
jgi:hypothetical protein